MFLRLLLVFCFFVLISAISAASEQPLPDWRSPAGWIPNEDGGNPPVGQEDRDHLWEGQPSLRLVYTDRPPYWGNLRHALQIPPNATAISFSLYKASSHPSARMFLWLFEEDGDGWLQEIKPGGQYLGEMPSGWRKARVPVAGFGFDPRGNRKKEFLSVNRLFYSLANLAGVPPAVSGRNRLGPGIFDGSEGFQ